MKSPTRSVNILLAGRTSSGKVIDLRIPAPKNEVIEMAAEVAMILARFPRAEVEAELQRVRDRERVLQMGVKATANKEAV